ncbi:MAG: glycoside hydrolase family 32 protein [Armatimonadota bacterium]|nr:GH32 C-terminal domain-containing protein [bacterium]MDW8321897.1 glycoside hydrolase family 32 protein [Armatimonadota bacterium]
MTIHYQPADGHVGDVVPFYWDGVYHAFYLKRREGKGTSYGHAVSRDLVNWETLPDAIDVGEAGEPDHGNCFTGSVVERNGVFHLFYTGHTENNHPLPVETICHATSHDLIHWRKNPANPILLADPRWYERDDWRDPFVFWNTSEGRYWMLLTARLKDLSTPRRGCIALATSADLSHWQIHPPLWSPNIAYALECPDTFEAEGRRFLLFSNVETRYRSFRNWQEPFSYPSPTDALDTPRFYAAKAFHANGRHLLAGWVSSNEGESDKGRWEWGGTMGIVRELVPTSEGHLWVRVPEEVKRAFKNRVLLLNGKSGMRSIVGKWIIEPSSVRGVAADGMALAVVPHVPADYRLAASLVLDTEHSAGFLLRLSEDLGSGYQLLIDACRQRALVRTWETWGDQPTVLERPVSVRRGHPIKVEIYLLGSILEVFFDDRVALTTRVHDYPRGGLGMFALNGSVVIQELEVATL